jgi:hypothetical protein
VADYTITKPAVGSVWHPNEGESVFQDLEPLITPKQLRERFLFGIPLVSPVKDPLTGKAMIMSDDILHDSILRAISWLETHSIMIFPRTFKEKHPWDKALFDALGYLKLSYRPVASIEHLSVRPANGLDVFSFPLEWVETAHLPLGQINIMPINIATFNVGQISGGPYGGGGVYWLGQMTGFHWVPAYWYTEYTAGFPNGAVPRIVNECAGQKAAITALQQLQASRALVNSQSLGMDGMQQSVSGPGNQTYTPAIQLLQEQLNQNVKRLKAMYGLTMFVSDVG